MAAFAAEIALKYAAIAIRIEKNRFVFRKETPAFIPGFYSFSDPVSGIEI